MEEKKIPSFLNNQPQPIKKKDLKEFTREVLNAYRRDIFMGKLKLWSGLPLTAEETERCKILEKNLDFLRETVKLNAYRLFGYDITKFYGIKPELKVGDIPEHVPCRKRQQSYQLPFNDEFRLKLLSSPKFKFREEVKTGTIKGYRKDKEYQSIASFYVTEIEHNGYKQIVVVKATTNLLNLVKTDFNEAYDNSGVNIQAYLGKDALNIMDLARLDFVKGNRGVGHQNCFDEKGNVIDHGDANWRKHIVYGSHLHLQTEKLELLNPKKMGSSDAIAINDKDKTFFDLAGEVMKRFNFHDLGSTFENDENLTSVYLTLKDQYERRETDERVDK